ncbi:MAG: hypothetical protein PHR26_04075 [Candidatus ainarchaeum sp.]|nr:hypothetical protein [Candidatus ainarchaeum sp.]MDD3976033.1 hypothetical protein [Candidatus ainarchaeum sp.]
MKFKNTKQFIISYLKNPKQILKTLLLSTSVFIGSQKVSAQQISSIKTLEFNPIIYEQGNLFSSRTFYLDPGELEKKTLTQSLEYRFGKDKNNLKYNFALEVGKNNMFINGKLVPDKFYSQIHTVLKFSEIFKLPISLNVGFDKNLNNFKLKDINILEKSEISLALRNKKENIGIGGSIYLENGIIKSYNGISEIKFNKNKYSAGIRVFENKNISTKFIGFYGTADLSKKGEYIFNSTLEGGRLINPKTKKSNPSINFSIYFKPKEKGKFSMYLERQTSVISKQGGVFVELNYLLKNREKTKNLFGRNKILKNKDKFIKVNSLKNTRRL